MKKVMLLSIICFWMLSAIGDCAKVQIADYGAQPFVQRYSEYIDSDSNFRTGKIGIALPKKRNLDSSFDTFMFHTVGEDNSTVLVILLINKADCISAIDIQSYADTPPEAVASAIDATLYAIGLNYEEVRTLLDMLIYSSNIGYTFGKKINRTVVMKKSNVDDEDGGASYLLFAIDNN